MKGGAFGTPPHKVVNKNNIQFTLSDWPIRKYNVRFLGNESPAQRFTIYDAIKTYIYYIYSNGIITNRLKTMRDAEKEPNSTALFPWCMYKKHTRHTFDGPYTMERDDEPPQRYCICITR